MVGAEEGRLTMDRHAPLPVVVIEVLAALGPWAAMQFANWISFFRHEVEIVAFYVIPTNLRRPIDSANAADTMFSTPLLWPIQVPLPFHHNVVEDEQLQPPNQSVHLHRQFSVSLQVRQS